MKSERAFGAVIAASIDFVLPLVRRAWLEPKERWCSRSLGKAPDRN